MSAGRFFGEDYNWKPFKEGLQEICETKKPGIILIGKEWCESCKKIGAKFQNDKELLELSRNFVMISCYDSDEPDYDEFRPDGIYYPRFFFVNRDGVIDYSIASRKEGDLYRYFYTSLDAFKEQMRKLL